MEHTTHVKSYYKHNTRRFLWFHRDQATKSIHQPLWKEASFTKKQAFLYSNQLILEEIIAYHQTDALTIIDLGCGVGSSIFYLLKQNPKAAAYYGITISRIQISMAFSHLKKYFIDTTSYTNTHFIEADFTDLPLTIPCVDIAFSIEAFVHATAPHLYFEQVSQKLKKGGKLILIDDFLNDCIDNSKLDNKEKKAIADFKYGWLANSLKTESELASIATASGLKLVESIDLTPLMRNNTFKHQCVRLAVTSFRWLYELLPRQSYYFRSWIGGSAKQFCLKRDLIRYKKITFEKIQ